MAFAPHIRMTALGRLGTVGAERFSYSLNIAKTTTDLPDILPDLSPNQDVWEDLAEDVRAFHARSTTRISPRAVLEEVKFAAIVPPPAGYTVKPGQAMPHGVYREDPVIINVADTPGGWNDTAPYDIVVPPQTAIVASLGTNRRGPSGKGRFFIPMPVCGLSVDQFQVSEAERDGIQASLATLVQALNNQPGLDVLDLRVVVASSKGYNSAVTRVRVGKVLDTMRSRRRSLNEAYDPYTPVS